MIFVHRKFIKVKKKNYVLSCNIRKINYSIIQKFLSSYNHIFIPKHKSIVFLNNIFFKSCVQRTYVPVIYFGQLIKISEVGYKS